MWLSLSGHPVQPEGGCPESAGIYEALPGRASESPPWRFANTKRAIPLSDPDSTVLKCRVIEACVESIKAGQSEATGRRCKGRWCLASVGSRRIDSTMMKLRHVVPISSSREAAEG